MTEKDSGQKDDFLDRQQQKETSRGVDQSQAGEFNETNSNRNAPTGDLTDAESFNRTTQPTE